LLLIRFARFRAIYKVPWNILDKGWVSEFVI